MIDLEAPIIPGEGAAGLRIGMNIRDALRVAGDSPSIERVSDEIQVYRYPNVSLWVQDDTVSQIMLCSQYKGMLPKGIGIGSTLDDVRSKLGPVVLDEEDNLVVEGMPGFAFEIDPDSNPSRLTEIYVFGEDPTGAA